MKVEYDIPTPVLTEEDILAKAADGWNAYLIPAALILAMRTNFREIARQEINKSETEHGDRIFAKDNA